MERLSGPSEIHLDWKPNRFVQSFTGVLEALVVLIFCFFHHIVIRVLKRSGLSTPCSCPARFRKHLVPILDDSFGSEDNCSLDHFQGFSKKVALEGFAELSTVVGGVNTRIAMAESRYNGGGDGGRSGYSTPAEDLTDREQRDRDHDQDVKDRELFEALQHERETLAVLYSELEQERNCSATAASEALAMISRLQEEKAAVQLEARQFQRMVLEKAMYDQEAIEALNELLMSREEEKLALEEEIRVCREKLDSVMRDERRQSLMPKAETEEGRVSQHSESPMPIEKEKIITTPTAVRGEQLKCIDKFSTTKSQVLTALVRDGQLGLGRKFAKPEEREDDKPEFPGFVSLRRRWGSQEVSLKTLEQSREERLIEERQREERRIEEKRLSVLEYVKKFEQQQKGVRLPVKMPSATRHSKSTEDSGSKSRSIDIDNSTSSIKSKRAEPISRVLATDDSFRRRLFEKEDCDEEQKSKALSSEEGMEGGGKCEVHPSSISADGHKAMASKVCSGTDNADECLEKAFVVHDVYEVQDSPHEVPAPVMGDAEMQPATPSNHVKMPSATKDPKSTEDSTSKSHSFDIDNSASSMKSKRDEPISRVLVTDDSLRRRLFEEEDCDEEQKSKALSSEEGMEDGGKCEDHPSGISPNGHEVMACKVCIGTDNADECLEKAFVVHDVYEVQNLPHEIPAPVMGDAEMQPATPSDRLGKPDLQTFQRHEDRDCLCLIHPSKSQEAVENTEKDLHWEDLQGKVKYKTLRVSKSLGIRDNSRSQVDEEVQELTQRLQALEADKFFMKQTIESLRRENGEMKLLQSIVIGLAIATIISQYVLLGWLLWSLTLKVTLIPPRMEDLRLGQFLKSGGYLLARTMAIILVMTLATSMAARQGAIQMAGHQICLQIWLAASLLSDSIALAGQTVTATSFAKFEYKRVKEASFRILQIGSVFGVIISVLLGATMPAFSRVFTTDVRVLNVIKGLIPVVVLTQPINSLAFVFDGLHYGASDFAYAAYSMILVAVPSAAVIIVLPHFWGLPAVWVGLILIMSLRLGVGLLRIGTATGPWSFLKNDDVEKILNINTG